nr:MAG TPA_asm: hypothetical protein [Caudoviricetes sp.]
MQQLYSYQVPIKSPSYHPQFITGRGGGQAEAPRPGRGRRGGYNMSNSRTTASPALYREIREKAEEIVSRRGPMLGAEELALELGVKDKRTAADWARLNDVPATPVGRAKKYEARLVAKALVFTRGMC